MCKYNLHSPSVSRRVNMATPSKLSENTIGQMRDTSITLSAATLVPKPRPGCGMQQFTSGSYHHGDGLSLAPSGDIPMTGLENNALSQYLQLFDSIVDSNNPTLDNVIQLCNMSLEYTLDLSSEDKYPYDFLAYTPENFTRDEFKRVVKNLANPQHPLARCIAQYAPLAKGPRAMRRKILKNALAELNVA